MRFFIVLFLSETSSTTGAKAYTYNALNLKETFTNARGQTRSFTYDSKGRITGYTCPHHFKF
jgi:uncharacterized protein RhaS with RHS repeats